jgi:hypothetical protein
MEFRQKHFADQESSGNYTLETREMSDSSLPPAGEGQWLMFETIMHSMHDELAQRHVPLVVSVLPLSSALEKTAPRATESYRVRARILEILERHKIETLDPWDYLESLVKKEGHDAVFLPQGDIHFSSNGHKYYADWLIQKLGPRLGVPN